MVQLQATFKSTAYSPQHLAHERLHCPPQVSSIQQKTAAVYETGAVFSGSKFSSTGAVFCVLKTAVAAAKKNPLFILGDYLFSLLAQEVRSGAVPFPISLDFHLTTPFITISSIGDFKRLVCQALFSILCLQINFKGVLHSEINFAK